MRRLYDDFVAARRRNGEAGDHMGYEKLASSVRKMESRLRERHKGKQIGFEVVVKNGKVGLKPKIG